MLTDTLNHPVTLTVSGAAAAGAATAPPALSFGQTILHYALSGLVALATQILLKTISKLTKSDGNSTNNQNPNTQN